MHPSRSDFTAVVLQNLATTAPYHLSHLVDAEESRSGVTPDRLHPAFHTSFDWHSCVHMHWLGVELLLDGEDDPRLPAALGRTLTAQRLLGEAAHLDAHPVFERPYGWAWAARLTAASGRLPRPAWRDALQPLADTVYRLTEGWLTRLDHPVRHGLHSNTAFGLTLLHEAADELDRADDTERIADAARRLFAGDRGWPAGWELSGHDFLSAGLCEADLMSRVLPADEFATWFDGFLPDPTPLLRPVEVSDPGDPHLVHLDGLNLSRAGAAHRLAAVLGDTGLAAAAEELLGLGLRSLGNRDFVATHWLATFAWDALRSRPDQRRSISTNGAT
ncbi:DUF2891 family protein [Pseudonocardia sp. NPDC049635]|uniref:DUF2891 family protein n=1 Tax=Pseudonocardia sp. NPDC049635 TaxID=3155506 RepID=UPI0033FF6D2F